MGRSVSKRQVATLSLVCILLFFAGLVSSCGDHNDQQHHRRDVVATAQPTDVSAHAKHTLTLRSSTGMRLTRGAQAAGSVSMACPVCGMQVTPASPYVEIVAQKGTSQRVYVCSSDHGEALKAHPHQYIVPSDPSPANSEMTLVQPVVECPFCKMDAAIPHALPMNGNQTIYACEMPEHYKMLRENETAISEKMRVVATNSTASCPVCGRPVTDHSPYVSIKDGQQKIYACSQGHAEKIFQNPMQYVNVMVSPKSTNSFTPIEPKRECPFCSMDAVVEHGVHLNGSQSVYACLMVEHYERLKRENDMKSSFSGVVVGDQIMNNTSKFCLGSGTVMLNGLTFSTDICITYLFDGVVLNETWKYALACMGTFLLCASVQCLVFLRSDIQKQQSEAQTMEDRPPTISELGINSSLFGLSAFLGYLIMLLTMTFSFPILLMVVFGLTAGHFGCSMYYRQKQVSLMVKYDMGTACSGCS